MVMMVRIKEKKMNVREIIETALKAAGSLLPSGPEKKPQKSLQGLKLVTPVPIRS